MTCAVFVVVEYLGMKFFKPVFPWRRQVKSCWAGFSRDIVARLMMLIFHVNDAE